MIKKILELTGKIFLWICIGLLLLYLGHTTIYSGPPYITMDTWHTPLIVLTVWIIYLVLKEERDKMKGSQR